ncbi:MAG TPA: AbrB/MazE/SpoVT family DNA-binding domain-containing protein [Chloroflexota bacterium]|nr:AbrB/MazE/SpoVT family DNA-binding domain-containing protein [Chloroflexota bacterium]
MNALIDSDGRIEIPDEIRRQAGLRPGMPVEVSWRDGRIEIEPRPTVVKLVRQGRLLVAVTDTEQAPLTADVVEETRRALEDEKAI